MDAKGITTLYGMTFLPLETLNGKPVQVVRFQGKVYAAPDLIRSLEHSTGYSHFQHMLADVQGLDADASADVTKSVDAAFPRLTNLEATGVTGAELLSL